MTHLSLLFLFLTFNDFPVFNYHLIILYINLFNIRLLINCFIVLNIRKLTFRLIFYEFWNWRLITSTNLCLVKNFLNVKIVFNDWLIFPIRLYQFFQNFFFLGNLLVLYFLDFIFNNLFNWLPISNLTLINLFFKRISVMPY